MAADMSDKQNESAEGTTLQSGGEEAKLNATETVEIDLFDRDPNELNDHVKVAFSDIFGEPDTGNFSFGKVWILGFKVFSNTRMWVYRILSLLFALPLSFCFGVHFACLSFCNIWVWIPCLKTYTIELYCVRKVWELSLNTCVAPCFQAMGRCFSGIRVALLRD